MRFCSLASGSTGNSYFVGDDDGGFLIDAGISVREIERQLAEGVGLVPNALRGILVTHEHIDHIKSVGALARRYHLPIYATEGTWLAMGDKIGVVAGEQRHILPEDIHQLTLGRFEVEWFTTEHDAFQPVGYILRQNGQKISVATDTGVLKPAMLDKLYDSDILVIEANHDETMLRQGRYPAVLKRRILSERGHLSNHACGVGLCDMVGSHTKHVVLAHLSQENNSPELAHQTVKEMLLQGHLTGSLHLWVAQAKGQSVSLKIGC